MNLESRIVIIDNMLYYGSMVKDGELILYQDVTEEGNVMRRYFREEQGMQKHGSKVYRFYEEELLRK